MKQFFIAFMAASMLTACVTNPETGQRGVFKTAGGAVVGAGTGALLGVLIGGNDKRSAAIGAAVGGLAGGGVGRYMDQQEKKLRAQTAGTGIQIVREGDQIQLALPADISFPSGKSDIQPSFYNALNDVSSTLREFPSTAVDIIGHADSQGADAFNQTLSEKRAAAVQSYILDQGVRPVRLASIGYGETRPIATNDTPEGRALNRRVEIILTPIVEDS